MSANIKGNIKPLNYNIWLNTYMKALFVLARTYNPKDEYTKMAMKCFIESLSTVLPDPAFVHEFQNFINPNVYVVNTMFNSMTSFFDTYKDFKHQLDTNPQGFFEFCLQSDFTLFSWVYLLDGYIKTLLNKYGHHIQIVPFNELYLRGYNPNHLDKADWGNPIWFIIHMTPLYAPGSSLDVYNNLKAMLSCLRFVLPCQKCQMHLADNLGKIDIDNCAHSRDDLFKCTWELHNIVNKDLNKRQPTLEEARRMYVFNY